MTFPHKVSNFLNWGDINGKFIAGIEKASGYTTISNENNIVNRVLKFGLDLAEGLLSPRATSCSE